MKREELLKSKEYWIFKIQNSLFNMIENYRKQKKYNKTQLANEFGFNKSYITQVLNGDFDHKISKLVELSLASGKAPVISFVDLEKHIKEDSENIYSVDTNLAQQKPIEIVIFNHLTEEGKAKYEYCNPEKIKFKDSKEVKYYV